MEKSIDMLSAIELAMEAEEKAHLFYRDGAERTEHPRGKDLFLQLAEFEKNHYDHLKELHDSLSRSGRYIQYGGTSFSPSSAEVKGERQRCQLESGSMWPAVLWHGNHNLLIQGLFLNMTRDTRITEYIVDDFGVGLMLATLVLGYLFWRKRTVEMAI